MNLYKRIATILTFGFFCRVFIACCACYNSTIYYSYKKEFHIDNLDDTGPFGKISTADKISKEAFGLRLGFDVQMATCKPAAPDVFSGAFATSCSCHEYGWLPDHRVDAITVTTVASFDASHPAGSDVSDLFKVLEGDKYKNIVDYLLSDGATVSTEPKHFIIELYLLTPPTNPGPHSFDMSVSFEADSVYSQVSRPVILE